LDQRWSPDVISEVMKVAIAKSHGAALATRNVRDFEDCGAKVVNPWGSSE
jgi:hypothetical protein